MVELKLPKIDLEHSNILDRAPMFLVFGLLIIMFIPAIPSDIKGNIILGGLVLMFPIIYFTEKIAQYNTGNFIVIKARIWPWKIEKEFYVEKKIGKLKSDFNYATRRYITTLRLQKPILIKEMKIPSFQEIEIEHKLKWETRNEPNKAFVHYQGIEVKCLNVVLCDLWFTGEHHRKIGDSEDYLGEVPRFRLGVGSEDYWLHKGQPLNEDALEEPLLQ